MNLYNFNIKAFSISLLICLSGCEPKKITSPFDLFEESTPLKHEIFIDDEEGLMAYDLKYFQDSFLILFNPGKEYIYDLVNLKNKERTHQFGKIGDGPGELTMPTQLSFKSNTGNEIGIFNRRGFQFVDVHIDSILNKKEYRYSKIYKGFDFNHYGLYKLSDNQFLGLGYFENRYIISDSTGNVVKKWGNYPFESELNQLTYNQKAFAFQGKLKVHPKEDKFVFSSHNSPNFEIIRFDEKNNFELVNQTYISSPKVIANDPDSPNVEFDLENIVSYVDSSVTKDYIYLLFFGETVKNIVDKEIKGATNVLVFDWKGNPVKHFKLDVGVSHIEVANDQILFAVNQKEKGHVYKFELN
jgi:hypothetical protein